MIGVSESASYRADSAFRANEVCIGHDDVVRTMRTVVNVENVRTLCDLSAMAETETIGTRLRALLKLSGLSMDKVAAKAGYKGRSSLQRYFNDDYDPGRLPLDVAAKLAAGFDGTAVTSADVYSFTGVPEPNAQPFKMEGAADISLERDVPVYGTALGAPEIIEGEAIEQTTLNHADIVTYLRRPPILDKRADVYGIFIQGSSMAPRFDQGETAFVEGKRPPRIGDDVVVYLAAPEDDGERIACALIKRLVKRTSDYVELQQFNPPLTFRLESARIRHIHRVVPWSELVS